MKKSRIIFGTTALLIALTAVVAFKAHKKQPGNLYYINSSSACVKAPCEDANNTNSPCKLSPVYKNSTCTIQYAGTAWATDGAK